MKILVLFATACLFCAASSDFVVWKADDLKSYEKKLHSKLNKNHTALERLPGYEGHSVYAVHREGTGLPEAHETTAHLIYVISGEATVIVGGTMIGSRKADAETTLGASVEGGEAKKVHSGDLIHIPLKVPHWFKVADDGQVTYIMLNLEGR
jgi:mannose-6-phosphate isomerase-like protein (cupin superfamily)